MVAISFNAAGVKPNAALEAVPTGQYPVIISASEEKPTKSGNGSYIQLEMTVQGGEFGGRKLFDRLNIKNPNQTAVDIAYATLSAICHVTGQLQISQTEQLHGKPFIAVVQKKEREDQPGTMTNEVKGYKDINGNDPGFAGTVSSPAAQPAWAGSAAPTATATAAAPAQQAQVTQQTATPGPTLNAIGGIGFNAETGQPNPPAGNAAPANAATTATAATAATSTEAPPWAKPAA